MEPSSIAERVWPGKPLTVEMLGGGITNRNFKVDVDGESYVLRVGGEDTALLGIDRTVEHLASRNAAELGLGPEVVAFVEPEGFLVTRFVAGEVGKLDLPQAGAALRKLHDGPPIPGRFDSFRVVERYRDLAAERGVPISSGYDAASEIAGRIERRRRDVPSCPCHNDLLSANFIADGERLWIVDWEYAGMGDPFFDLGNFAVNNELDEAGERTLLAAYGSDDLETLTLMRFMSDFREAMWGVVQQAISTLDYDFVAYAEEHFERLGRTAAEPRFRAALE